MNRLTAVNITSSAFSAANKPSVAHVTSTSRTWNDANGNYVPDCLVDNLVTRASNFGGWSQVFNGVDVLINAQFGGGTTLVGGLSTGQFVNDFCNQADAPAPILHDHPSVEVQ